MPMQCKITRPAFKAHYDVVSTTGDKFYININTKPFSPKTPTLAVYSGDSPSGPILTASFRPAFGETYKLAFGDPAADPPWEDLQKTRRSAFEYKWSALLPSKIDDREEERHNFIWKRTKSVGVDGEEPLSWSQRNWKLVQEGLDETVLAVFTAERPVGKCGTLQINVDWDGFNDKVLLTLVSMYHRTTQGGG